MTERKKIRTRTLAEKKRTGEKIVMVTAHDALTAAWADAAGVDVILVGDSLMNTALGEEDTIGATVATMTHHTAAVRRGTRGALVVADMPFMSYKISEEQALENATALMQQGRAEAVKVEGGREMAGVARRLVEAGIPVMGHIGLLPQSVHQIGGYRRVGGEPVDAERLKADARALEGAGAFAVVLEMMPAALATEVTAAVGVATIGIGSGAGCDGQVLVMADLLGMQPGAPYGFVKQYDNFRERGVRALAEYAADVREGRFPGEGSES